MAKNKKAKVEKRYPFSPLDTRYSATCNGCRNIYGTDDIKEVKFKCPECKTDLNWADHELLVNVKRYMKFQKNFRVIIK